MFIEALGLCCGELLTLVLRGDGIGFLEPADVTRDAKFVCTLSAVDGRVDFEADDEAASDGLAE